MTGVVGGVGAVVGVDVGVGVTYVVVATVNRTNRPKMKDHLTCFSFKDSGTGMC